MVFSTQRDRVALVATWEPEPGNFALIVNGRPALMARTQGSTLDPRLATNRRAKHVALSLSWLARDLAGMLSLLGAGGPAEAPASATAGLAGWRCHTCDAPTISVLAPNTVGDLECPGCLNRRATTERAGTALAIGLAEARIRQALEHLPAIAATTRTELEEGAEELRRLGTILQHPYASRGARPDEPSSL